MADVYEVIVNVKGAGRKEIASRDTYSKADAERELAAIREVQQAPDEWLDLPWLSVQGSNVIVAFIQATDAPRPDTGEPRSAEELTQRMIAIIERMGLKVVNADGTPLDAEEEAPGGHEDNG